MTSRPGPFANRGGWVKIAWQDRLGPGTTGGKASVYSHDEATLANRSAAGSALELTLFGGPRLDLDGSVMPLSPFQGALVGILAAHGQRGVRRGQLMSFLWREGTEGQLRHRLNQLIYSANQRLQGDRRIRIVGHHYVLDTSDMECDLARFLVALRDRAPATAVEIATRGFLSGLPTTLTHDLERWIDERDVRFRSDVRTLAMELGAEAEHRADWKLAEVAAEALLRLDPEDEGALRKLLEAKALLGKVREAEASYVEYRDLARLEDPSWSPEAGTTRILAGLEELASRGSEKTALRTAPGTEEPPLVGREEELTALTSWLRSPPEDGVRIVLVSGEGGIGKTRLVKEALARAPFDGVRVLSGNCSEFEQNIPLSPILRSLSPDWVGQVIRAMPEPWRGLLLGLLPELLQPGEVVTKGFEGTLDQIPRATCEAFLRLFGELARSELVVLFLDDSHWLDATSLSVLAYLCNELAGCGLTIVLAVRPEELPTDSRLSRWLDPNTDRRAEVCRLALGPLSANDIIALVQRLLPEGISEAAERAQLESVAHMAAGHPLLALEWSRTRGQPTPEGGPEIPRATVPGVMRRIIRKRIGQLSDNAQHLVESLAASEKPLPYSLLEWATDSPAAQLSAALDEAVEGELISVSPRGVAFRHDLFRQAIYQSLSKGRQLTTHRRIAEGLVSLQDKALHTDIALHFFAAAEPQRALPHVLEGARAAIESGGWPEARRLLTLGLETGGSLHERGPVAALLGRLLVFCGEFEEAERVWTVAESAYRTTAQEEEALTCRLSMFDARRLLQGRDCEDVLKQVRELRQEASDRRFHRLVGACMNVEARMLDELRRIEDVKDVTQEARRLGGAGGDVEARLQFLFVSMIDAVYGDPEGAIRLSDEAAELARHRSRPELLLRALNWKVVSFYLQAKLNSEEGQALIAQAVELATASTDLGQRFWLASNLGAWYEDIGDYAAAHRALDRAAAILRGIPAPHLRRILAINRGQLAFVVGQNRDAAENFRASLAAESAAPCGLHRSVTLAGLGLTYLGEGNVSAAQEIYRQLPETPTQWTVDPYLWLCFQASLTATLGRQEESLATLRSHEEGLRTTVATSWMRVRLLRFRMALRFSQTLPDRDIEELEEFLVHRRIDRRLTELQNLLERRRSLGIE